MSIDDMATGHTANRVALEESRYRALICFFTFVNQEFRYQAHTRPSACSTRKDAGAVPRRG